jgi:hypothetical protein
VTTITTTTAAATTIHAATSCIVLPSDVVLFIVEEIESLIHCHILNIDMVMVEMYEFFMKITPNEGMRKMLLTIKNMMQFL